MEGLNVHLSFRRYHYFLNILKRWLLRQSNHSKIIRLWRRKKNTTFFIYLHSFSNHQMILFKLSSNRHTQIQYQHQRIEAELMRVICSLVAECGNILDLKSGVRVWLTTSIRRAAAAARSFLEARVLFNAVFHIQLSFIKRNESFRKENITYWSVLPGTLDQFHVIAMWISFIRTYTLYTCLFTQLKTLL